MVVLMMVVLLTAIADAGWAFMRTSMIAHAARDGARYGATLTDSAGTYRNGAGCFTGAAETLIRNRISNQLDQVGFAPGSPPDICQGCIGNIPITRVTITGTMDLLFGLVIPESSFPVSRAVVFEDEIRDCTVAGGTCGGCPGA
jgi:hypothetical protein